MTEKELSNAEAELYDRQIRLWGLESQEKLRAANVLLINTRGLGSEIAKDVLLSGINSLTILDEGIVTEEEYTKNFLLSKESVGMKIAEAVLLKAQALNPLVKITADTESFASKSEEYFSKFTIIVATGLKSEQLLFIDEICRKSKVKFICGDVFGLFGFTIADFLEHHYYEDRIKLNSRKRKLGGDKLRKFGKTTAKVQGKMSYPAIENVLPVSEKKILKSPCTQTKKRRSELYYLLRILIKFRDQNDRDPLYTNKEEDLSKLKNIRKEILQVHQVNEELLKEDILDLVFGEIASVCAIVGGVIAQEVIKAVSHKEVPINNVFLLDPYTFSGKEEIIGA